MEKYYRYLHENPELSGKEFKTSEYVIDIMEKYDVKIFRVDLSVICFFDRGRDSSVAFRSELDALPIIESEEHKIRSKNTNMHACGHDVHTSALLKLAEYVNGKNFDHNICFIFQSMEESGCGSKQIVNSDIFNELNIKYVIGLHVWPNLKKNKLFSNEFLMYGSFELDIIVEGESNHVSDYNCLTDATFASFLLYEKISQIDGDYICHCGCIKSGSVRNISSNKSVMNYSIRFRSTDDIRSKIENIKIDTRCKYTFNFINKYIPLINDTELLNNINYTKVDTQKAVEDFGYYGLKSKIVYLLYGLGKGNKLHTEKFSTSFEDRELYYLKLVEIINIFKSR